MTYQPTGIDPDRERRPMIGISASEVRAAETLRQIKEGEPTGREIALGTDYVTAIARAGGIPVVIPPVEIGLIEDLLSRIEGVCLSGGPDIDPAQYGADESAELGPTDADVDRFEIELARTAVRRRIPVLAICRGMQVLNVSFGGSLIQHLPAVTGLPHRQDDPGTVPTHAISIEPQSTLARIAGETDIAVNTFHHQAIDRLGGGLQVSARARDGVIEAVECPDYDFVLGVQWHAELAAAREIEGRVFSELVDAAAPHRRRGLEEMSW